MTTIRTENNALIYSKSHLYSSTHIQFLNNKIQNLFENNRRMGFGEDVRQIKSLVVDIRSLSSTTTSDRYPISYTTVVLSEIGNASNFTTFGFNII